MHIHRIGDVTVLNDYAPVPGFGGAPPLFLPVNAFVLHAEQPVVIDTGLSTADKDFVSALAEVLDPADVRWIWITHPDRDHTGGLWKLLQAAPQARLVTTFLGLGIMSTEWTVPLDRLFLLNPGEALNVGDRRLHCFRPPLFDSPSTTGFLDDRTGALFSSDCFGAPMPSLELATSSDVRAVGDEVRDLQLLWASIDSPWVHHVDPARFRATVDPIRALGASAVFSSHLPPVPQPDDRLYETVLLAPQTNPFVGPDQAALEALLATFAPAEL
jgi:glyoxylase-like metal-dependent hydrolase (beta-lactamase superfamily II)